MKVLFATDGFEPAHQALGLLKALGDRETLQVTAVSVAPTGFSTFESLPLMLDPIEARRKDAKALVDWSVDEFREAGFEAKGVTREGHPSAEIATLIDEGGYELILVGAGRHSWMGRKILGSVSTSILHRATGSILVVHDFDSSEGRLPVTVATDGSPGADAAVLEFIRFADPARCSVEVVTAVSPVMYPIAPVPGSVMRPDSRVSAEIEARVHQEAQTQVERTASKLSDEGFDVTTSVRTGAPMLTLVEASKGSALMVVGARGLGPIRRGFLGSVSDHLVRHSAATLVGKMG